MKLLAVLVPAKDEESTIGELLDRISTVEIPGYKMKTFVVDDGSTDNTARISRSKGATIVRLSLIHI